MRIRSALANFTGSLTSMRVRLIRMINTSCWSRIFIPSKLYSRTCGQQALDVFWTVIPSPALIRIGLIPASAPLILPATLDEARKQLVVYVVNQTASKATEAVISLTGGEFAGNVKVSIINVRISNPRTPKKIPIRLSRGNSAAKASGKLYVYL